MAFGALKDKNFILGLIIGVVLFFGSSIPLVGDLFEFIFDNIEAISPISDSGVFSSMIHAFLLSLLIYVVLYLLIYKTVLFRDIIKFSLGFLSACLLFLLLAYIAISQFDFSF